MQTLKVSHLRKVVMWFVMAANAIVQHLQQTTATTASAALSKQNVTSRQQRVLALKCDVVCKHLKQRRAKAVLNSCKYMMKITAAVLG